MAADFHQAQKLMYELKVMLTQMHERDPNQEVGSIALKPLDQVLSDVKPHLKDDALINSIRDVISPELIEDGGVVPVGDLLILVTMIVSRIGAPIWSAGF